MKRKLMSFVLAAIMATAWMNVAAETKNYYVTNIRPDTATEEFTGMSVFRDGELVNGAVATGDIICKDEKDYIAVVCGDVNADAIINSTDFMRIRRNYLGSFDFTEVEMKAADTNGDNNVNSTDFMQIRKHYLGLFMLCEDKEMIFDEYPQETVEKEYGDASNAIETLIQQDNSTEIIGDVTFNITNPTTATPAPDPELHRFGNEYWMYTTYGEKNINAYVSYDDMTTWELRENIIDMESFTWAVGSIWAPSVIEYDGKYYMAFSANYTASDNKNKYGGIAMGVSDEPGGPFVPLIDEPIIQNGWDPCPFNVALIDPHLFADDDGTVYLYFGNGTCAVSKLSTDLKSIVPLDDKGTLYKQIKLADYCEGPFMIKRDGIYYLMYSCDGFESGKYRVAYATSTSPTEGFSAEGVILGGDGKHVSPGHHSCIYIKENNLWLICYHRYNNGGARRRGAIDIMYFNEDGSIKPVVMTSGWDAEDIGKPIESDNLALSAVAIDSGYNYYNGNATKKSINDNIIFSGWQYNDSAVRNGTTLTNCWVGYDFGEETAFSSAVIMWESGTKCNADGFSLQYSVDGETWFDIPGQTVEDYDSGRVPSSPENLKTQVSEMKITFDEISAQFVRINMTKGTNSSYCPKIYEFGVYK